MDILEFDSSVIADGAGLEEALEATLEQSAVCPVVLVGAMGQTGQRLVRAGEKAAAQDLVLASTLAEGVRTSHLQIAQQLASSHRWSQVKASLSGHFEELSSLIQGLYLLGELSHHAALVLAFYGERASALIFSEALGKRGVEARAVANRETFLLAHPAGSLRPPPPHGEGDLKAEVAACREARIIPVVPASLQVLLSP